MEALSAPAGWPQNGYIGPLELNDEFNLKMTLEETAIFHDAS
jgi:hypothetical protein